MIYDAPASGAWNMAVDEALARALEPETGVLRFYRWTVSTISLGRNQPALGYYDEARAAALGIDFVRRPTGGRAVLHDRELTYSVVVPDRAFGGPKGIYTRVQEALAQGLVEMGAEAEQQPELGRPAARPSTQPCFTEALPGEVTVSGRKLVGSAQARISGAVLQHGSILIQNNQSQLVELTTLPTAVERDRVETTPITLGQIGFGLTPIELAVGLQKTFARLVAGPCDVDTLTPEEHLVAEGLLGRFQSREWTWRR